MGYLINMFEYYYIEWYIWDYESGIKGEYVIVELYYCLEDLYEMINIVDIVVNKVVVECLL